MERFREWREERRWRRARPLARHHFILERPREDSELIIPIWFEGTFDDATQAAIEFVDETFEHSDVVVVKSTECQWAYLREPDDVSYFRRDVDARITSLLRYAHDAEVGDDAELAADLRDAVSRLEFIRDSDAEVDDRAAAWGLVEGAIEDAEIRALSRVLGTG